VSLGTVLDLVVKGQFSLPVLGMAMAMQSELQNHSLKTINITYCCTMESLTIQLSTFS
jgi:hypothetical protein